MARRAPPDTKLVGLDMNTSQQPSRDCLPPNVTIHRFDLLATPLEAHLREAFDIINIQLIVMFVQDEQIGPALRNILAMLKPGGYLQFSENMSAPPLDVHSPDPWYAPKYMQGLWAAAQRLLGLDPEQTRWPETLGKHLWRAGFKDVREIRPHRVLSTFRSWTEMSFMGFEVEIPGGYLARAGDNEESRRRVSEYMEQVQGAQREFEEHGVTGKVKTIRAIGRKPEN